jgi:outer membrane phospholipase A
MRFDPSPYRFAACVALLCVACCNTAQAAVAMLQLPREVRFAEPLQITLLFSADAAADAVTAAPLTIHPPATLRVTLSNGDQSPQPLDLLREPGVPDTLELAAGQYRKVRYAAPWPQWARGEIRINPVGFDASPAMVAIDRSAEPAQPAEPGKPAPPAGTAQAARTPQNDTLPSTLPATQPAPSPATASAPASAADSEVWTPPGDSLSTAGHGTQSRISYFEPMYFAVGHNGDTNARLQLSFKYRLLMPDDLRSRRFLDNLYFAYTQTSIWDLTANSRPFRDTSYQPQLFYYVPDTGWRASWFTRMGIAAGVGHESNGKGGSNSRGLNTLFVRPTWEFGNLDSAHWVVSPKFYVYAGDSDNEDNADYRGYADLLVKYGSPDGWQLATTLRKGTHHGYGSIDTQLTYPLAKLLGSAWGGYLWVGYFNGYGEDLLDYNRRQHWMARVGFSIAR